MKVVYDTEQLYTETIVDSFYMPGMTQSYQCRLMACALPKAYAHVLPYGFAAKARISFNNRATKLGHPPLGNMKFHRLLKSAMSEKQELLEFEPGIAQEQDAITSR